MAFAVAISEFCELLPRTYKGRHVAGQLFRSATSVAANYRAACRARSKPDFISKIGLVIEESDESEFWLDFSVACRLVKPGLERELRSEAGQLVAIFTCAQKTARSNSNRG